MEYIVHGSNSNVPKVSSFLTKMYIHAGRKQSQQVMFSLFIIVIDTFEKNHVTGLSNGFFNAGVSLEFPFLYDLYCYKFRPVIIVWIHISNNYKSWFAILRDQYFMATTITKQCFQMSLFQAQKN